MQSRIVVPSKMALRGAGVEHNEQRAVGVGDPGSLEGVAVFPGGVEVGGFYWHAPK